MKQIRSTNTHRRILNAAVQEFCQAGYDNASVAAICQTADVSKGAFYYHFSSKQNLFLAIIEDWLGGVDQQLASTVETTDSVPDAIQNMAGTLSAAFEIASGQLPMFLEFMVQASRDEEIWPKVVEPYRAYQQQIARIIQLGIQEGSFSADTDADNSAWVMISLAVGLLLQSVMDPQAENWENVSRLGIQMIVRSMRGRTT